jgi:hypothetical protein
MGSMIYKKHGPHVEVKADNDGSYGIFTINHMLQRLDCQAEPRLLYLKAQYYAYTFSLFLTHSQAVPERKKLCISYVQGFVNHGHLSARAKIED